MALMLMSKPSDMVKPAIKSFDSLWIDEVSKNQ